MTDLVRSLFDEHVKVAEIDPRTVSFESAGLHPTEAEAVRGAVDKRRREYAAGRVLARELLSELGIFGFPLLNAADRAPIWPPGIVGSITHTDRWVAVALVPDTAVAGLGCDLELDRALARDTWRLVFRQAEVTALERLPTAKRDSVATAMFSAKEALHKAQYPLSRRIPEFQQVEIEVGSDAAVFTARFHADIGPFEAGRGLPGRWGRSDGLVAAAVTVPAVQL